MPRVFATVQFLCDGPTSGDNSAPDLPVYTEDEFDEALNEVLSKCNINALPLSHHHTIICTCDWKNHEIVGHVVVWGAKPAEIKMSTPAEPVMPVETTTRRATLADFGLLPDAPNPQRRENIARRNQNHKHR